MIEVVEFDCKHAANVHESLAEIRRLVEPLVNTRDQRRDGFAKTLAKRAIASAKRQGGLTVLAVVDALTRLSAHLKTAGDRAEADERVGRLFVLAA